MQKRKRKKKEKVETTFNNNIEKSSSSPLWEDWRNALFQLFIHSRLSMFGLVLECVYLWFHRSVRRELLISGRCRGRCSNTGNKQKKKKFEIFFFSIDLSLVTLTQHNPNVPSSLSAFPLYRSMLKCVRVCSAAD